MQVVIMTAYVYINEMEIDFYLSCNYLLICKYCDFLVFILTVWIDQDYVFLTEMQSYFPGKASSTLFVHSSGGTVGQELGACAAGLHGTCQTERQYENKTRTSVS